MTGPCDRCHRPALLDGLCPGHYILANPEPPREWDGAPPVRPDTTDTAVHQALTRTPGRKIEDVHLP